MNRSHRRSVLLAAAFVLLMPLALIASDDAPSPRADEADALRGPSVENVDVPGSPSTFGEMSGRQARMMADRPVPHRVFREAVESLTSEEAAPELRLTREQQEALQGLEREAREARRAYLREHGPKLRELRSQLESLRRGEQPEDVQALQQQISEIMRGAPQMQAVHAKAWGVLTEEQRAHVELEIEQQMQSLAEGRAREMGIGIERAGGDITPDWATLQARYEKLPEAQQRLVRRHFARLLDRAEQTAERAEPPSMRDRPARRRGNN